MKPWSLCIAAALIGLTAAPIAVASGGSQPCRVASFSDTGPSPVYEVHDGTYDGVATFNPASGYWDFAGICKMSAKKLDECLGTAAPAPNPPSCLEYLTCVLSGLPEIWCP